MANTLPVKKLIQVGVTITAAGALGPNLNTCLIIGDSNVIDVVTRLRTYETPAEVATDFGNTAPEYLAATLYFGRNPQPQSLYIGRWAHTATAGELFCAPLSGAQQLLSNWTAITTGSFEVSIDATAHAISGLDFASATSLNDVASIIQTALAVAESGTACVWDANYERFEITSGTTGTSSKVSFLTATGSGTDISAMMGGLVTSSGAYAANGIAAETALASVQAIEAVNSNWFGLMFAAGANNADIVDADYLAIAAYVESESGEHLFGVTTSEGAAILSNDTTSIGYLLKQEDYNWTFVNWSSTSPYAGASYFGLGVTVNFLANNSTITFAWKSLPGVVAENLNSNQAAALDANHYSYYANFNNGTAITVNGTVASGHFIDEVWGAAWFGDRIQTDVWNLLYTTPTKIPQTDAGMNQIATTIEGSCNAAVNNGYLAPGQWNSAGFGQLAQGQFLDKGYYIYAPPISSQDENDRASRVSVPFQVAAKEAGAVQDVSISVVINQ